MRKSTYGVVLATWLVACVPAPGPQPASPLATPMALLPSAAPDSHTDSARESPTPSAVPGLSRLWGWIWVRGPRSTFGVGESIMVDADADRTGDTRGGAPYFGTVDLQWELDPRDAARATLEAADPTAGTSAIRVTARAPGPIRLLVSAGVFYGQAALLCLPAGPETAPIVDDRRFAPAATKGYGLPDGTYIVRDANEWRRLWFGERTDEGEVPPMVLEDYRDRVPDRLKVPPAVDFASSSLVVLVKTIRGPYDVGLVAAEGAPSGAIATALSGFPDSNLPTREAVTRTYLYRVPRMPVEVRTTFEDLTEIEDR